MRRRTVWSVVLTCAMLTSLVAGTGTASGDSSTGIWQPPIAEKPLYAERPPQNVEESLETPPAVSTVVLPDGRILYWGGLEGLEDSAGPLALDAGRSADLSRARVLDLSGDTPSWSIPEHETGGSDDMFCADQRIMYNGKVLVAGGTIYRNEPVDLTPVVGPDGPGGTAELFGSNATRVFDPAADAGAGDFYQAEKMDNGRWYPTLVTLPDGRLFVASGVQELISNTSGMGFNVAETETFDPVTETWENNGEQGATTLPLFARLHLLPSGDVFYGGVGQMWSPAGQAPDEALWNLHKAYDPVANEWSVTGVGELGARSGAFSVLLPLRPDDNGEYPDSAEILVGGGNLGVSPGTYVANNFTEIISVAPDETGALSSSSRRVADLNNRRWYSSGVLLPDGSVVAVSGADKDEVIMPGTEAPVRQAELWDGESWTPLGEGSRDRTYHNTAVLLPDGRVLVAGHSPINAFYGDKGNSSGDTTFYGNETTEGIVANNLKDPSLEILEPPYLFRGDRPEILGAPEVLEYGAPFAIGVDSTENVTGAVLVRMPSTTHITDADMRMIELKSNTEGESALQAIAPPDGNVAPPGYYYLFVMADNGQGPTPSVAKVVNIKPSA